ncbi:MAG: hypothetical protein P8M25_18725 [Paracoccaceae bacterium]|nr:hypothetical protein [Paracoccaceae bacterium]
MQKTNSSGVFFGLLITFLAIELRSHVLKLVKLETYSAAPTPLFSIDIIDYITPMRDQLWVSIALSRLKVLLQLVVFCLTTISVLLQSSEVLKPSLIVVVDPCGTILLVFSSAYDINPKPLVPIVVLSFLLSIPLV